MLSLVVASAEFGLEIRRVKWFLTSRLLLPANPADNAQGLLNGARLHHLSCGECAE